MNIRIKALLVFSASLVVLIVMVGLLSYEVLLSRYEAVLMDDRKPPDIGPKAFLNEDVE